MKKNLLLFPILALLVIGCTNNDTCTCTPGHNDYLGHCPCQADDCTCPVRIHIDAMDGLITVDIWHREPLTATDTVYLRSTSSTYEITHLIDGERVLPQASPSDGVQNMQLTFSPGTHTLIARATADFEPNYSWAFTLLPQLVVQ